jgi:hypothetical protein
MRGRSLDEPTADGGFEAPFLRRFLLVRRHFLLTSSAVQFSSTLEVLRREKNFRVWTMPIGHGQQV